MVIGEILRNEPLSKVGYRRLVAVAPHSTLAEAVAVMQSEKVGSVLVCESDRLVGMLTERHVIHKLAAAANTLDERVDVSMIKNPETVRPDESVASAICKMQQHRYRRLPVVDADGTPLGLLSMRRIIQYMAEHFPSAVFNLPPRPDHFAAEREGA
ncbi:MAG: CBS domain-containing protein [Planctomycetes bacterium]|nr:CBS domain-containing protein [Planctomycetota bacterium]